MAQAFFNVEDIEMAMLKDSDYCIATCMFDPTMTKDFELDST